VLLDEIEKAHPKVLNLFLQVLDEGQLRAADGTVTDFRNTIIIATSNAGALYVRDRIVKEGVSDERAFTRDLVDHVLRESIFTPEFVNRFDATVVFRPLTGEDAAAIAKLMVAEVVQSVRDGKGIEVEVTDDAVTALLERGYSPEFGARELRRIVSDVIENHLADRFLREAPKRGDAISIRASDLLL
jgi:ATP-dependent Clp protease ATP-binding subunit ClpC